MHCDTNTSEDSHFTAETELAAPVEAWLASVGSTCIGREVEVGFGIPDLVAGVGTVRALRNRRRQAQPLTRPVELDLLEYCYTSRSADELRKWAPHGYSELKRRTLVPLIKAGKITESQGKFRARVRPKDPFDRLIAVELKLGDIKRGISQAYAYRAFADVSYLAVPAHRLSPEIMQRCRSVGIGLLAVHKRLVEEIVRPDAESYATPGRRRMASEHTMAANNDSAGRIAGAPRRS